MCKYGNISYKISEKFKKYETLYLVRYRIQNSLSDKDNEAASFVFYGVYT